MVKNKKINTIPILEAKELISDFIKHYFKHLKLMEMLSGQVVLTEEIMETQTNLLNSCKNTFLNSKYKEGKNGR